MLAAACLRRSAPAAWEDCGLLAQLEWHHPLMLHSWVPLDMGLPCTCRRASSVWKWVGCRDGEQREGLGWRL